MPRLRARYINRRFGIAPERLGEVLADARLILAGSAAARALAWDFPSPSPSSDEWPLEAYVAEGQLAAVFEQYQLERDEPGELLLRSVTEPWPFSDTRVVPPLVAALDLAESSHASLAELGDGLQGGDPFVR